jgi:hypothetical protein
MGLLEQRVMAMEDKMKEKEIKKELPSPAKKMAAKVEITEDWYKDANAKLQQTDRSATALSVRIVKISLQRVFVFPV